MDFKDRRTQLVIAGAAVALLAGLIIALSLTGQKGDGSSRPPASRGGLVIDSSDLDEKLDPARPLRCFVAGQFVGELTLADCAQRNGVATGALDVGLDETGALAAAEEAGTTLTPLPPLVEVPALPEVPTPNTPAAPVSTAAQTPGACWRYSSGQWRRLPGDLPLGACVQALFAGRCERPGGATYGRWMQQTLRLVPGRVEISADDTSFRTLAEQGANCAIGPVG
jgi:hypothetical protein